MSKEFIVSVCRRCWHSPLATTWAATATQLISLGVVLPLVLGKFPAEEVRFWFVFNSLLILSLLVEVGFSSTFGRLYSFAMAGKGEDELGIQGKSDIASKNEPNWETVHSLNGAGQRIFLVLSGLYFVILISFGSWVVGDLIDGLTNPKLGWAAWFVMAISQPLAFLGKKYGCYLTGTGLIAVNQRFTVLVSFVSTLAMVLALVFGGGIFTIILVSQLTALLSLLRARFLALRARPGRYRDSLTGKFPPRIWEVAWPTAWKSAVGLTGLTGTIQLTGILYGKEDAPADGAEYLFALLLMTRISQIANAPFYSKLPLLGRLRGAGDLESLVKLAKRGMSLATLVFVIGVLGLALVGPFLLDIFKKEVGFPPLELWFAMGGAFAIQRFGVMHLHLYSTTNHIIWHWVGGITAIVLIALIVILTPIVGGLALPLAMAIAYGLVFAPWSSFLSYRSLKLSPWEFERAVSLPALGILTLGGALIFLNFPT